MGLELVRGYRGKLDGSIDTAADFTVRMETEGGAVYDTCCFGVDAQDTLSDDRYMVFYNQTASPNGEIRFSDGGGVSEYTVALTRLPQTIAKLVFTVSIDGEGTMGGISRHSISIWQNGAEAMRLTLGGADFNEEKAIIGIEIYNKTVWRLAVVASGFNGGLADLLANYGGEVAEEQPAPAQTAPVQPQVTQPTPQPAPVQPQVTQPAPKPAPVQPQTAQQTVPTGSPLGMPAPMPPLPESVITDYTPKPFVTVPLPAIPPIPPCAAHDYKTAPLPTGYIVQPETRFDYFRG